MSALSAPLAQHLRTIDVVRDGPSITIDGEAFDADTLRDLRQIVSGHLYSHWHIRRPGTGDDTRMFRDSEFESILSANTPHSTTLALGTLVAAPNDGITVVTLDGVRVGVSDDAVAAAPGSSRIGDTVAIRIPASRPTLSPGFWLADSSAGRLLRAGHLTRFYLSIAHRNYAPAVWRDTLTALEAAGVRYRAKVGSTDRTYPRTDAMVIYVDDDPGVGAPAAVAKIVTDLVAQGLPVSEDSSLFTRAVTRGVGTAAEPADRRPGMGRMSFGEHRCFAVATGILDGSSDDIETRVARALTDANVRPDEPALNIA